MKHLKNFLENVFCGDRLKNFCEDLFFFFFEIAQKIFVKTFFFVLESTCACVLGPWPWPRAFLSLASRVSVLGKAVLGLGFFLCPWLWPRALCPRLHLWLLYMNETFFLTVVFQGYAKVRLFTGFEIFETTFQVKKQSMSMFNCLAKGQFCR